MQQNNALVRDTRTKFLINKDDKAYADYRFKVEIFQELKSLKEEIEELKHQIAILKEKN